MLAGITSVFGLPIEKATLSAVISATIGTAGTTVLGKTIVANLIKFIPGVGSVAGAAISASTAAALTAALGEAYIGVMTWIATGEMTVSDLNTVAGQKKITDLFLHYLSLKRNKNGAVED